VETQETRTESKSVRRMRNAGCGTPGMVLNLENPARKPQPGTHKPLKPPGQPSKTKNSILFGCRNPVIPAEVENPMPSPGLPFPHGHGNRIESDSFGSRTFLTCAAAAGTLKF
jgi:hypothetical protein